MGAGSSPAAPLPIQLSAVAWESSGRWPKCLGPAPVWETWRKLLAAGFMRPAGMAGRAATRWGMWCGVWWAGLPFTPETTLGFAESPYCSKPRKVTSWRSLKTAGSMPLSSRTSLSPQKLWLGSAKQGHVPGTPVYREKEDMYDEIIELKKSLHVQKSAVDLMRTKLRRLQEENSRKDRQIEQLLEPGRGPDVARTLAEKRPDAGWVMNGLRQRIFKLERQCKEKDTTINKLQTDMKTTNLEEMRIAMETYYEEIRRLQTLLASSESTGKKPAGDRKAGVKRQKKMSSTLLSLSRSVQELTEENQSLKEDLDRVLSSSPTIDNVKGYVEWSKPRLLRRIAELEKKINSMESSKAHAADVGKPTPRAPSASTSPVHRQPPADCQEDLARLRGAVKSLKGERGTLQAQLLEKDVELRQLLQAKADLETQLESAREGERQRREQEQAWREEIQTLTTKLQELEETAKGERSDPVEASLEAQGRPASPASSRLSPHDPEAGASGEGVSRAPSPCTERRRDAAARVLQTQWRLYKHQKKTTVLDEVAVALQAAFRGHLARAQLLSRQGRSPEPPGGPGRPAQDSPTPRSPSPVTPGEHSTEAAVVLVQSALRGHLARARLSATSQRAASAASARNRPASAPRGTTPPPPHRTASPGEDGEASGREATEDLEQPATPQAHSARSSPSGLQPGDDVDSDDSDDVVIAPLLPTKKSSSHPRFPSPPPPPNGDGCQG
uniref:IQ motif containing E n=3 Tax=Oryctolagus cuniculus TaxID=9986 RepID=A0A5F9C9A5_RABIT